jgi:signal transduction histidine kinase/Tfp pilus assembly protein PilF
VTPGAEADSVQVLLDKGQRLIRLSLPDEAFAAFYQAREAALASGDPWLLGQYDHAVGMAAYQQKKYGEALIDFQQAYTDAGRAAGKRGTTLYTFYQENLDNVGLCYHAMGKEDSALPYFDRALYYLDRGIQPVDTFLYHTIKAVVEGNKAAALVAKGDPRNAEALLWDCVSINRIPGHKRASLMRNYLHLGQLYLQEDRLLPAARALALCRKELDSLPDRRTLSEWCDAESDDRRRGGDFTSAIRFARLAVAEKDTLRRTLEPITSVDVEAAYNTLQNAHVIRTLETRQKTNRLYYVLAFLFVLLIAVLLWTRYWNNRYRVRQLLLQIDEVTSVQLHRVETAQVAAKIEARRQIGQELHDDFAATLASVMLYVEGSTRGEGREEQEKAGDIRALLREGYDKIRSKSHGVFFGKVDDAFWQQLGETIRLSFTNTGIQLTLDIQSNSLLSGEKKATLVYVVKESCSTIVRSGTASSCTVQCFEDSLGVHLVIRDNGKGLPAWVHTRGRGWSMVRHRIEQLGGILRVDLVPGGGTLINVTLSVLLLLGLSCTQVSSPTAADMERTDAALFATPGSRENPRLFPHADTVYGNSAWGRFFYDQLRAGYAARQNNFPTAIQWEDSAISIIRSGRKDPDYSRMYAAALLHRGDYLYDMNRPQEALAAYYQGRNVALDVLPACEVGIYNCALGSIKYKQKKFGESIRAYAAALEDFEGCADEEMKRGYYQASLDNIGLCYMNLGRTDSALYFFDSTLRYLDRNEARMDTAYVNTARALVWGNKASVLLSTGDLDGAEALLTKSIAVNRSPGHAARDLQYSLLKLGRVYLAKDSLKEAGQALSACRGEIERSGHDFSSLAKWADVESLYHEKAGDLGAALSYAHLWGRALDTLDLVSQPVSSADPDREFLQLRNEYAVDALEASVRMDRLRYLAVVLGLLFVAILLWFRYRRHRRKIKQLLNRIEAAAIIQLDQIEKAQVDAHQAERTLIGKELDDDFAPMMSVVTGYLENRAAGMPREREGLLRMRTMLLESYDRARARSREAYADLLEDDFWQRLSDTIGLFFAHSGIRLTLDIDRVGVPVVPGAFKATLVDMIKECCGNVIRHAHASSCSILMYWDAGDFYLLVEDDGRGMPARGSRVHEGLGLTSIRRRVAEWGGAWSIDSQPGKGTRIEVRLPGTSHELGNSGIGAT